MRTFKRNTGLLAILRDGWSRGLDVRQVLAECSQAGYARCVSVIALKSNWLRWEAEMEAFFEQQAKEYHASEVLEHAIWVQNMEQS